MESPVVSIEATEVETPDTFEVWLACVIYSGDPEGNVFTAACRSEDEARTFGNQKLSPLAPTPMRRIVKVTVSRSIFGVTP